LSRYTNAAGTKGECILKKLFASLFWEIMGNHTSSSIHLHVVFNFTDCSTYA
jgi:hypothetical protein